MRTVNVVELGFSRIHCPQAIRPILGGPVVGGLGLITPQVLSSGHGALELRAVIHASAAAQSWRVFSNERNEKSCSSRTTSCRSVDTFLISAHKRSGRRHSSPLHRARSA